MLRNYLVTALRNFARHRLYSFINIAGLAVGLACVIFIALFLRDELSWNRWIPDSGNVWRVETTYTYPGSAAENEATAPFPLGAAMQAGIPDVQAAARLVPEDMTVKAGDRQFPETIAFTDPDFFSVVRLPLVRGDAAQVLAQPESVVLSQSMARKYFGATDPLGKTLTVEGKYPLTVTGIVRDPPHNSDFRDGIYVSNKSKSDEFGDKQMWFSPESFTYVRLLPGARPGDVIAKAQAILRRDADPSIFIKTNLSGDRIVRTRLVPLRDIHLVGDERAYHDAGSWTTVYGFAAIAALILAIAGFNFTNLATARAMTRARETGLRKVVGAKRIQLIAQFLGESVLTALLALVLALAIVEILLPAFDGFLDRPIAISYLRDWQLSLLFGLAAVAAGLLAGIYPALILSGFRPAAVLHAGPSGQGGSGLLRTGLVVLQFAISIGLGVAALVVFAQIRYARQIDLGFDRDNLVVLEGVDELTEATRQSLMHRLAASANIAGTAESSAAPFRGVWQGIDAAVRGSLQNFDMRILTVTPDFFRVYGMKLRAGRLLSSSRGADVSTVPTHNSDTVTSDQNVLVNVAAAQKLGFIAESAVGKIVQVGPPRAPVRIVGIVGDAKFYGVRDAVDPTIYIDRQDQFNVISVRVVGGRIPEALADIDRTWHEFAPTVAIRRHFLDDSFDRMFASAEQQGTIFGIFVGIAIFIACLGLFGLAAFSAERRTREIGVRKVFGANTRDVVRLLLWQFSIPVLIANLIAWPVAWYYLHNWLESYAYRISLSPLYFLAAGAAALLIAWATVIGHSLAVARANPVHALRYE
ncbi:MAG TPA: ABC transporter permease [Rhizomicrobium sp.]|jgi:putative ABC transport system permease protein